METDTVHYAAGLTIDVVIFTVDDGQLKTLLIRRSGEPFAGDPALPGGFLQKTETIDQAAQRILQTKAGIAGVFTEQLYTFDGSGRDPRGKVVSIAYFALTPREQVVVHESPTTQEPSLYPVRQLPKLAFDHNRIVEYAIQRLEAKLEYTNVVYSLLPELFTLSQLQTTYEVILNRPLDKRNFRKKFLSLDMITATDKVQAGGRHRPAQLYKFNRREATDFQRWF